MGTGWGGDPDLDRASLSVAWSGGRLWAYDQWQQCRVANLGLFDDASQGSGNVLLTVTGSSFAPGMVATWNGSYRTTTIVDATHATVAIPASDLATAGTGSLVATNPGAAASNGLSVTVQ